MEIRFEWNSLKARSNLSKHHVSFEEASTVFGDVHSLTVFDSIHSIFEPRFVILGRSYRDRLIVVVFTERGEKIRIISARAANRKERKTYEKAF